MIKTALTQIRKKLDSIYDLVSKPKVIYKTLRCEITEDKNGEVFSVRWTDQHYFYDDKLRELQAHKYSYEVTSRGISLFSYVEYNYNALEKYNRDIYNKYWSCESPEASTIKLWDVPRGKYSKHIEIIREHLSKLPAWAWAVAC